MNGVGQINYFSAPRTGGYARARGNSGVLGRINSSHGSAHRTRAPNLNDMSAAVLSEQAHISTPPILRSVFTTECKLFLGNLPDNIEKDEIVELFSKYGEVSEVVHHEKRGIGFLRMDYKYNAMRAQQELDEYMFKKKRLEVKFAKNNSRVWVGDLAPWVSDEMLVEAFSRFGRLEKGTHVMVDPETRKSKGYGFVQFYLAKDATSCLKKLQKQNFVLGKFPRPVRVEPATEAVPHLREMHMRELNEFRDLQVDSEMKAHFVPTNSLGAQLSKKWKKMKDSQEKERKTLGATHEKELEALMGEMHRYCDMMGAEKPSTARARARERSNLQTAMNKVYEKKVTPSPATSSSNSSRTDTRVGSSSSSSSSRVAHGRSSRSDRPAPIPDVMDITDERRSSRSSEKKSSRYEPAKRDNRGRKSNSPPKPDDFDRSQRKKQRLYEELEKIKQRNAQTQKELLAQSQPTDDDRHKRTLESLKSIAERIKKGKAAASQAASASNNNRSPIRMTRTTSPPKQRSSQSEAQSISSRQQSSIQAVQSLYGRTTIQHSVAPTHQPVIQPVIQPVVQPVVQPVAQPGVSGSAPTIIQTGAIGGGAVGTAPGGVQYLPARQTVVPQQVPQQTVVYVDANGQLYQAQVPQGQVPQGQVPTGQIPQPQAVPGTVPPTAANTMSLQTTSNNVARGEPQAQRLTRDSPRDRRESYGGRRDSYDDRRESDRRRYDDRGSDRRRDSYDGRSSSRDKYHSGRTRDDHPSDKRSRDDYSRTPRSGDDRRSRSRDRRNDSYQSSYSRRY